MVSEVLNLKVDRMTKLDGESKVKAFCDLVFGDLFLVKGFRIVEGEKGMFVGMPQQQSKQGKWFSIFLPATTEIKEYISETVLQAYRAQGEGE
ncbi:MAG: septation protein SpoVG family protein [Candidatus Omnitrophica bacterium]|nr:septation protein SpoVG family protein [Candidatus Omnitrophota bacterium]